MGDAREEVDKHGAKQSMQVLFRCTEECLKYCYPGRYGLEFCDPKAKTRSNAFMVQVKKYSRGSTTHVVNNIFLWSFAKAENNKNTWEFYVDRMLRTLHVEERSSTEPVCTRATIHNFRQILKERDQEEWNYLMTAHWLTEINYVLIGYLKQR
jgi:hypothetical protein